MLIYHPISTKCNNDRKAADRSYGQPSYTFKTKGDDDGGTLMIFIGIRSHRSLEKRR
jgi:hypothetical protein